MRIPILADIPVLGPILFDAKPYVYVGYILVIVLTYMLFRTRWGLRLRASGREAGRGRHRRHQRPRDPLSGVAACRDDRGSGGLLPVARDRRQLPDADDRRQGLHRARRDDLRRVAPGRGVLRRPRLRFRRRRAETPVESRRRRAATAPCQHPVRRHDRRRGRRRRARPRARRRPASRTSRAS